MFGGPFKSKLIGVDNNYMKQLFAYIHLNPLDIKFYGWDKEPLARTVLASGSKEMKEFLESYRHSSYQDYLGVDRVENNILSKENFPDYFENQKSFKDFVESYFTELTP